MLVVIDANVVCSALLARGKALDVLLSGKLDPVAPELLFFEVEKHTHELFEKTKLSAAEFSTFLLLLRKKIRIIPAEEFESSVREAYRLLHPHIKDVPYVALASHFNCPLWSKEKRLKELKHLEVLDAEQVAKRIGLSPTEK
jgi:predicted nucleic acid-binding protein